ncbi:MAG: hypothetical protein WCI73_10435 [Phycisphaerae bacterium]
MANAPERYPVERTARYRSLTVAVRQRGTADIEMLLAVLLLITFLFLLKGLGSLGMSRLEGTGLARFAAFHDATAADLPVYSPEKISVAGQDTTPYPGYLTLRGQPYLPLRMHVPRLTKEVKVFAGDQFLDPVTLHSDAMLPSPAWTINAYPVIGDRSITQTWFENYANESVANLRTPLELAAPWTW